MNYAQGNGGDELPQEQSLDLLRYWKILFAKRWLIFSLSLTMSAVAIAFIYKMPSRYQATASLVFEVDQANPVSVEEIYDLGAQRRDYILTQTEMLKSRQLAERVIERLDLINHPEFAPKGNAGLFGLLSRTKGSDGATPVKADTASLDNVASAFLKRLTISPARNTNLVKVEFEAQSAKLAADVANALVEEFIFFQSEAKEQFTNRATSWLNERLETLRSKLEASETNLQRFRETEDLVDLSGVRGLSEQDLNAATSQLQETRREFKQITSVFNQFERLKGNELALANLPEVISNPLIQEIKRNEAAAERNVSELARRYKPKHPTMIAASNELEMIRNQLASEVRILAESIESQYNTARARVEAQEQEVQRAKAAYQSVSQKEFRYQELVREVDVSRQLYDTFFTRANETREASGFEIAPARFLDSAVVPNRATKPNKKLLAMMALALSAVLATAIALLLDFLRMGVRSPEDVEVHLGQNLIGLLPQVNKPKDAKLNLRTFFDPDHYTFNEAVRTLRTGVVLTGLGKTMRTILVTSSVPAEGKTTVAENLAFALSQVERVLLVDLDLRKPTVASDFRIASNHPGITDLIQGNKSVEDCVYIDTASNLHVMPSGSHLSDPQKLLVSPQFSETICTLAQDYDRIVIDSPPVQAVSDALIISRLSDALLYVVKYDSTNKRTVSRGVERLTKINSKIDGVVLTHVDTSKDAIYADEYYDYDYGNTRRGGKRAQSVSPVSQPPGPDSIIGERIVPATTQAVSPALDAQPCTQSSARVRRTPTNNFDTDVKQAYVLEDDDVAVVAPPENDLEVERTITAGVEDEIGTIEDDTEMVDLIESEVVIETQEVVVVRARDHVPVDDTDIRETGIQSEVSQEDTQEYVQEGSLEEDQAESSVNDDPECFSETAIYSALMSKDDDTAEASIDREIEGDVIPLQEARFDHYELEDEDAIAEVDFDEETTSNSDEKTAKKSRSPRSQKSRAKKKKRKKRARAKRRAAK
ncbi:polysaccharide biosynthesis tyrosine autokinase [Microbulbifer agarilyticus]|uniref:polysaccharide biosynthesis tyrosine autokinase n=1 Tax=Microbulbifer agarilyticus TaxID=260552 RepID=UPI001CD3C964|nr:polysaccharide biosynthesis tyrosine autokinase [Microbulbifer agarilyticus]MCA0902149.1 polysaccharide biosynthesis tyrosine autokinase [Microbulbifer agarilyticus]